MITSGILKAVHKSISRHPELWNFTISENGVRAERDDILIRISDYGFVYLNGHEVEGAGSWWQRRRLKRLLNKIMGARMDKKLNTDLHRPKLVQPKPGNWKDGTS